MFARTLKLALAAAGVGLAVAVVFDRHEHRCSCGRSWSHFGAFNHGDVPAHTCSTCGAEQWRKGGMLATARTIHRAVAGG